MSFLHGNGKSILSSCLAYWRCKFPNVSSVVKDVSKLCSWKSHFHHRKLCLLPLLQRRVDPSFSSCSMFLAEIWEICVSYAVTIYRDIVIYVTVVGWFCKTNLYLGRYEMCLIKSKRKNPKISYRKKINCSKDNSVHKARFLLCFCRGPNFRLWDPLRLIYIYIYIYMSLVCLIMFIIIFIRFL